jgi:hypothetical protein
LDWGIKNRARKIYEHEKDKTLFIRNQDLALDRRPPPELVFPSRASADDVADAMGDHPGPAMNKRARQKPSQRTIQGTPFCWQDKRVMRKIRECFDKTHTVDSALAVYVAMTEIASDHQADTFTTTHAHISQKCGCSLRTVASRLKELQQVGLISIATPELRAPSTFTLLAVLQPLQDVTQPMQSVLQRTKKRSLQALEESPEESKKGEAAAPITETENEDVCRRHRLAEILRTERQAI